MMSSQTFPDETTAAALQAVPDAVIAVDGKGVIRFANSGAEELTAYLSDELVGQRIEILVPRLRQTAHRRYRTDYQHDPTPRLMGARRYLGLRRKDGVIVPVVISLSPLPDSTENIVLSTVQDVSEQERRSKEYILLDELGALVAREHEIANVYELLESSLPGLFEFDRLVVSARVPGTKFMNRAFVSGKEVPGLEVGTRGLSPELYEISMGSLPQDSIGGPRGPVASYQSESARAGLPSWLHVPLGDREDPSGYLSLWSTSELAYTQDDLILLERVASLVSPAFENARLYARVRKEARERTLLAEISRIITSTSSIEKVYERIADRIRELVPFDRIVVATIDWDRNLVTDRYVAGLRIEDGEAGNTHDSNNSFSGELLRDPQPRWFSTDEVKKIGARYPGAQLRIERGLKSIVAAPLIWDDKPIGVLIFRSKDEGAYGDADAVNAMNVANQIAGAIANDLLRREIAKRAAESDVLASVSRIVTSTQDMHDVFGQFADAVRELVPADRIFIRLMNEDKTASKQSYGWGRQGIDPPSDEIAPVAGHPMELLVGGQSSINIGVHNKVNMAARYPAVQAMCDIGFESIASTILRYQDQIVGGLVIASTETNAYHEREITLLEEISAQVAGAIVNSELTASVGREAERRRTLAEIGRVVSGSLDAGEFFDRFAVLAKELIPFDSFGFADFDPDRHVVTLRYSHGYDLPTPARGAGVSATGTIAEKAASAGQAILVTADPGRPHSDETSKVPTDADEILKELICVPLTSRNLMFGCLYLGSERSDVFTDEHLKLADQLAAQVSGAISNARSYEAALRAEKDRAESEARSRELERLNEERSAFLSTVSHELKTPLTALTAFADILIKNQESNLTERQFVQVQVMQRSARRLDVLINDLLDVSRLDVGKFNLTKKLFEAKVLVEELQTAFIPIFSAKEQSLHVSYPERATCIDADQDRIAQLISNLLSNASKYSDRGSKIALDLSADERTLSITVTDTGIGMSEETQNHLFVPFFRSDDAITQAEPGTGLGLVITKSIAELHGGTISVSSKQGSGTTIRVSLPLRDDDALKEWSAT